MQQFGITAGASFVPVSGTVIDITDLVGKGYEVAAGGEGYCDRDISIQTLNEYGQTLKTYQWMDDGEEVHTFYGWYPEGSEEPVEKGKVTIQPGEGLWVYCNYANYSLQSSGQVPTAADVNVTLQQFGLSVANPTPITVDLANCYVTGYEVVYGYCDRDVSVQTLNEYGQTLKTYQWMDDGEDVPEYYGWYPEGSEDKVLPGAVPVLPGQGLWTYSNYDGLYFNWPKVDVK